MNSEQIKRSMAVYIGGIWVLLDRDRLATAYLVYLDFQRLSVGERLDETINKLLDLDWDIKDAYMYSHAAAVCAVQGIEP